MVLLFTATVIVEYFTMTIGQISLTVRYVLRINYDYHTEGIDDIQNVSPVLVAGGAGGPTALGVFISYPLRADWGCGLNVNDHIGSPQ